MRIRLWRIAVGGMLAMTVLVAGCGGGSGTGPESAPGGPFPATVPGKFGPATIASRPVRVVAMSWTDADIALGMGVVPVGMSSVPTADGGIEPWTRPALNGATPTLFDTKTADPIEAVAALRPDVILATKDYNLAQSYAQLSRIAPVVTYQNDPNADTWPDLTTRIGTALGVPDAAKRSIDETDSALARARDTHPQLRGRSYTLLVSPSQDGVYAVNSTADASATLLSQLGLTLAPGLAGTPGSAIPGRTKLSYERLPLAQADVMLATGPPSGLTALEALPTFRTLPTVTRGGYVRLDPPTAQSFAFPSPISIRWGIDSLVPKISTALGR